MPADNPLREGQRLETPIDPCVVVIFGASGDLTKRKLIPALFNLARGNHLPAGFAIVGVARTPLSDDAFRQRMQAALTEFGDAPVTAAVWDSFARSLFYVAEDFADAQGYSAVAERLAAIDRERGTQGNRLFYLATPPSVYPDIVRLLGARGLAGPNAPQAGWKRIVIEKPFGRDLTSARALNQDARKAFAEEQIFRIDHYLGKETVQNLLVFRFGNGIFEPIWNRRYIDHVQITAAERLGVEDRGAYYEEAGVARDMIQNHMLQLLCMVAMEPPVVFDAEAVRNEKVKVLRALRPITPDEVDRFAARGQYGDGSVGGTRVVGYRKEPGVGPQSNTETFAAVKFLIDNWRWADVPFYVRSGKRLPKQVTEIAIHFRRAPHLLFGRTPADRLESNVLALRIQPDEGIALKFVAKRPGQGLRVRPVNMEFRYGSAFGVEEPSAYETLLLECMRGDATLFARGEWVEQAWAHVMPIIETWRSAEPSNFPNYEAGSWGPEEADALLARDGRVWRRL
ncbi:MAG TPA: glucose-6-phosphate dehydrogenase [Candidatus Acidoferrales bacterium]|nr:glucose-6-phosphate dehydrogenase [Candidatus Acidoferrales bacterium]